MPSRCPPGCRNFDDPDGSPWSSWPLWQPIVGGGTGLNIGWSYAASVAPTIVEIAARHNVIIYDPQADQLIQRSSPAAICEPEAGTRFEPAGNAQEPARNA